MAVRIRLKRMGSKNRPFFRIVVADAKAPRDGKFIEEIGYYDPLAGEENVRINEDRALYWLGHGARPTETVSSFFKKLGVLSKVPRRR